MSEGNKFSSASFCLNLYFTVKHSQIMGRILSLNIAASLFSNLWLTGFVSVHSLRNDGDRINKTKL